MITIVTVANEPFLPYIKALVVSAKMNFSSARVFADLVNVKKNVQKQFCKNHPNIETIRTTVPGVDEKIFCSNRKCNALKEARSRYKDDILLWVDADSVFVKNCNHIEPIIDKDLAIWLKPTKKKVLGLQVIESLASVFSIGPGPVGDSIINDYVGLTQRGTYWGSDQDYLSYIYVKYQKNNLGLIPKELLDTKATGKSLIWNLKCKPKELNGRFQRRKNEYTALWAE